MSEEQEAFLGHRDPELGQSDSDEPDTAESSDESEFIRGLSIDLTRERERLSRLKTMYPGSDQYINGMVEVEQMITGEEFVDRSSLTSDQKRAIRESLLAPEVAADLRPEEAAEAGKRQAMWKKMALFLIAVMAGSTATIMQQIAVTDPETGVKSVPWIKRMPIVTAYAISVFFSCVASPILYGPAALQMIFDASGFMRYGPIALAYVLQDVAVLEVQTRVSASLWKVVAQSKMVMTAVGGLYLGRRQSLTQWFLLLDMTLLIILYGARGLSLESSSSASYSYLGLGVLSLAGTTTAGLACEMYMKKTPGHFITQFGAMRLPGVCVALCMCLFEVTRHNQWHLFPFGNFLPRTWLLIIAELANSWTVTLVVKKLDSLWKTFVGAVGLSVTYTMEVFLLKGAKSFNGTLYILIIAIAINVVAYAAAARDRMKVTQLVFDAQKQK